MTRVWLYEMKKLVTAPAVLGFCVLCLVLNTLITFGYDNERRNDVSAPVNIFAGYSTSALAESDIAHYALTGQNAENVRALYAKLQPVVDAKAERGEAVSPYLGSETVYIHGALFGIVLPVVLAEGCILAMLLALLGVGYENIRNTEHIVYASRAGRGILGAKLAAAVSVAPALFAGLLTLTLLPFFLRFDFAAVWRDYVSSGFNRAVNAYSKPFISWHSFTAAQYLTACIAAAFALVLTFTLMSFAFGALIRNLYHACMTAFAALALAFFGELLLPLGSAIRGIVNMAPLGLWLNAGQWFTDGGVDIIHAHFETWGLAGSLALVSALCGLGAIRFKRRELL